MNNKLKYGTIISLCLFFFSVNGQNTSFTFPIIINEVHGSLSLIRIIHNDAFKEGIYKVKLGKEDWVEYRNDGDSILYYAKYAKGYSYYELGAFSLHVLENDRLMLQSQMSPFALHDTVLTHYAVTKTGSWFYFNKSGKIIKQEFYKSDIIKPGKVK